MKKGLYLLMVITHAHIKTMEDCEYADGYLQFRDGKILSVGDMADAPADNVILDASGKVLLPGFIDPHCHIGMWEDGLGFEGDDGNEETDPITPNLRALDAVNPLDRCFTEALQAGITTVVTGPGSANPIGGEWLAMKTFGSRIDDMIIKAPVGMKFALGENPKSSYNSKNQTPITRMATAALIREHLKKAQRYLEDLSRAEQDEDYDPPEYDAKSEALLPVIKGELKAFFHVHRADDICTAIRIAKEFHLNYLLIHCTEGHLIPEVLKSEHSDIIIGPIICDRSKPELRNFSAALGSELEKNGISFALCTDHPVVPIQYLTLSGTVASSEGLSPDTVLKSITCNAAKICGISDRVGSIVPGKDADFILFDCDPLIACAKPTDIFICGRKVK